jgi:cytochrome c oxidase subunit 1
MPRRVVDYLPLQSLIIMNQIATTGAWMIGFGYILFAYNLIKSAMFGKLVNPRDPFELAVGKEYYYDFARREPHH